MRKPTRSALKAKATTLHSILVRARGACEKCGERDYSKLQCAHIISRRFANTRVDLANAFCLCAKDHMRFTEWPLEFAEFVVSKIGEDGYHALRVKAEATTKVDWEAELARLRQIASEMGVAA